MPVTLVGIDEAYTTVGVAETTKTVAKNVEAMRVNAKELRNALRQFSRAFANT